MHWNWTIPSLLEPYLQLLQYSYLIFVQTLCLHTSGNFYNIHLIRAPAQSPCSQASNSSAHTHAHTLCSLINVPKLSALDTRQLFLHTH